MINKSLPFNLLHISEYVPPLWSGFVCEGYHQTPPCDTVGHFIFQHSQIKYSLSFLKYKSS